MIQNYKIDILTYNQNNQVKSDCGDITFQNNGSVPVTINGGLVLPAGAILTLSANAGEIDRTIYTFFFPAGSSVTNCNLIVLRKVFI